MRRLVVTIALLTLAAPAAAQAQSPPLRARLSSCGERTAIFTGSMPKVRGTKRMWMRFDIVARGQAVTTFAAVKAPGLSLWQKSASASGFVFSQRVQGLAAPGSYKAIVRFRWYGAGGKLLRSTSRETATCVQPDPRPDLRAGLLAAAPGPTPDQATYTLVVRNVGRGAAGAFDVAFGALTQPVAEGLAPGATWTVSFVAPRCAPGSDVSFTLDAGGVVDEAVELDDVVTRPCPLAA